TAAEMAARVDAVRRIAIDKRGVTPVLRSDRYLRAAAKVVPPKAFLRDWKRGSPEGFLFPETYGFTQRSTARDLVAKQLRAFRLRFGSVSMAYARSKNLTPYDILKIASMIEEETAVASERRLVAAVIYNRLRARMPLGIDATLRYGLGIPSTQSITKAALRSDSPYNSRRFPGLPPTPITNPGLASIRAAASPADVPYLYYVRIPGTVKHFFTADESEFLRKVCEYGYACN
ncbi:MAG: endolytic transglycosylase MltG, partial [Actinobacteria bacterium]|nr:endolytic transglycosylase MltG [Actinomycetota bacterium]